MKTPNIAVIYFPGNNCEEETLRAVLATGMDGRIVRWNQSGIEKFDGYVIPGGWAYEDRIRAGVIASKDKIMDNVGKQAEAGKPLLGICNGAQILVETGLIPGLKNKVEMALAPNINPFVSGYYCTWINVKNLNPKTAFTSRFAQDEIVAMPIAHGEGRFTTKDADLIKELEKNSQIVFKYCNKEGKIINSFPVNPNGAVDNIAAISSKKGNIMAIMPHPERTNFTET
ncbi:phosphoribosylformylglycinamidine synthase I [Candidatus Woesearchaeota archaeon]|nr:phosphoribosylformylglycinamidine synthase I [Candidatus Woesearchaeota archaeon]